MSLGYRQEASSAHPTWPSLSVVAWARFSKPIGSGRAGHGRGWSCPNGFEVLVHLLPFNFLDLAHVSQDITHGVESAIYVKAPRQAKLE